MIIGKIFLDLRNTYLSDSDKDFSLSYGGAWIEGHNGSVSSSDNGSILIDQGSGCDGWGESSRIFISWTWVSSMGSSKKSSFIKSKEESDSTSHLLD